MQLKTYQCISCGGTIKVNFQNKEAVCPHCNQHYILDEDNDRYVINNNFGPIHKDFEIRAGELIKYEGSLADVIIPNTVTIIGKEAFMRCAGLRSVVIPTSVTAISDFAFAGCGNLTSISIPNSVTYIGRSAFRSSGLTKIVIPDSIKIIEKNVFKDCRNLKRISIPDTVETVIFDKDKYNEKFQHWPFDGCPELAIIASDQWKHKFHYCHPSLYAYKELPEMEEIRKPKKRNRFLELIGFYD